MNLIYYLPFLFKLNALNLVELDYALTFFDFDLLRLCVVLLFLFSSMVVVISLRLLFPLAIVP